MLDSEVRHSRILARTMSGCPVTAQHEPMPIAAEHAAEQSTDVLVKVRHLQQQRELLPARGLQQQQWGGLHR